MRHWIALLVLATLSGCASSGPIASMPRGEAAYSVISADPLAAQLSPVDYRIGPLDTLDISVFGEPDLSVKALRVDSGGLISLPLVGTVEAKGKSPVELSRSLERLLGERYLRDPQVTVSVAASVSQKVSIQGAVADPGVYPLAGPTTLLDTIAMAKGETDVATLNQVVVFRMVDGRRMGAVFDIASIRRGQSADPVIEPNDMVVVGYSAAKRFWRNVVTAAPVFAIFRPVGL